MTPMPASSTTAPRWDEAAAAEYEFFFENLLIHPRGRYAGKPFTLLPWQRDQVRSMFGWKVYDEEIGEDVRLITEAYTEIPGKNGKTEFGAGLALAMFFLDGVQGGNFASFAENKEQARFLFGLGKDYALNHPALASRVIARRDSIEHKETGALWRVWPGDEAGFDGIILDGATLDEVHRINRDGVIDIIRKGLSVSKQGLLLGTSTAGDERSRLCLELHDYGEQVNAGTIENPRFLYTRFGADEGDDPADEEVWAKANPSLGVTKTLERMRNEWSKAQVSPARRAAFKRFHLNFWGAADDALIDIDAWNDCPDEATESEVAGMPAFFGLDLSTTTDISSACFIVPHDGVLKAFWRFWMPEDLAHVRQREDRVPYIEWSRQGYLTLTPGNVVDYGFIRGELLSLRENLKVVEVGFDPWNATHLSGELADDHGFSMVPVRQGFQAISDPTKRLLAIVAERKLDHGGNPVAKWMAANAVGKEDENGNIRPVKNRSRGRIDGIMALVMALYVMDRSEGLADWAEGGSLVIDL